MRYDSDTRTETNPAAVLDEEHPDQNDVYQGRAEVPGSVDAPEDRPDAFEDRDVEDHDADAKDAGWVGAGAPDADVMQQPADEPAEEPTELKPDEAPQVIRETVFAEETTDGYHTRWHEVQVRFLDDPQAAATEAEALLGDVLTELRDALDSRKSELDDWNSTEQHDTEKLRVAVRGYRDLLNRVLAL